MKLFYDFHIHSALSPCAEDDMTPNNIVNMALLKELDAIAITDHNSIRNLEAFSVLTTGQDILFIPGIEVQTKEDVHVLCLFMNLKDIKEFYKALATYQPGYPHRSEKFGSQLILDAQDEVVGEEAVSLLFSLTIGLTELAKLVERFGGLFIPAHIGRPSYSILSQLGFIPPDLGVTTVEINGPLDPSSFQDYRIIKNSDAHQLGDISERLNSLEVKSKDIESIFESLRRRP